MKATIATMLRDELLTAPSPEALVDRLFRFIEDRGRSNYDELVTQLEHALQCAALAQEQDLGNAAVTAALLHDIGHLLVDEHDHQAGFLKKDLVHEDAGASFLGSFFGPSVTEPVRLHVIAKRYLCTIEEDYYRRLSPASKRSFQLQGGKLNAEEQDVLKANHHLDVALALRRIDDQGKLVDKATPGIDSYGATVQSVLRS